MGGLKQYLSAPNVHWPWRRKWQPIPVSLPGKFHGQRNRGVGGYNPYICKGLDVID